MEKNIIQIQTALFFKSAFHGDFEEVSLKIKEKIPDINNVSLLPIPKEVPDELPRLTLQYEKFNINVSKNRLDIFFGDYFSMKENILTVKEVLEDLKIEVGRIGFVKNLFCTGGLSDVKSIIAENQRKNLDGLKDVSIRVNIEKKICGFNCNDVQDIKIGKANFPSGEKRDGLVVVRDVNTLQEESQVNTFDAESIGRVLDSFNIETELMILL
ncbi:MAG: hypothetical protein HGB34_00730 [Candidatus Moranbacteria bacterium]|nr:hypothetical protein [Candidatus Moranbacteria bacterium]